jgi:hypothetical protein
MAPNWGGNAAEVEPINEATIRNSAQKQGGSDEVLDALQNGVFRSWKGRDSIELYKFITTPLLNSGVQWLSGTDCTYPIAALLGSNRPFPPESDKQRTYYR